MNRIAFRGRSLLSRILPAFSSVIEQPKYSVSERSYELQFSKKKLTDFGELPHGQIPDALKVSRPIGLTKLSNGVRVCSESWTNPLTTITVVVKAGARNETLENSSVSQFIGKLVTKGTTNKSKEQLEGALEGLGGHIKVEITREVSSFSITFTPEKVKEAVDLLHDVLVHSKFDEQQVEAEKEHIHKQATCIQCPKTTVLEASHNRSFQDHFLGQPLRGIRENIHNITAEQIREFHKQHYIGNNIVVSAAGNINHEKLTEAVSETFGKLPQTASGLVENSNQPYFTPGLTFMRDDELKNTSTAIGFLAPGYTDPDFYGMRFLKRVLGKYSVDKFTGAHLNSPYLQYNTMHARLGGYPDILVHEPFYKPYSDVGLFGNFMCGNEVFNNQLVFLSQSILTEFASRIPQVEVFRARAKYFNELLNHHNSFLVSEENAYQAAYLGRVVTRTEIAQRITLMDPAYISRLVTKWFWDKEISVVAWGPLHNLMTLSHYNRPYKRSTLGEPGGYYGNIV